MPSQPIHTTPIHELPDIVLGMSLAFCGGDQQRSMAVLKRVYEKRTFASIAAETGVPETTIRRLAKGFGEVCQSWLDRRERVKTGIESESTREVA